MLWLRILAIFTTILEDTGTQVVPLRWSQDDVSGQYLFDSVASCSILLLKRKIPKVYFIATLLESPNLPKEFPEIDPAWTTGVRHKKLGLEGGAVSTDGVHFRS